MFAQPMIVAIFFHLVPFHQFSSICTASVSHTKMLLKVIKLASSHNIFCYKLVNVYIVPTSFFFFWWELSFTFFLVARKDLNVSFYIVRYYHKMNSQKIASLSDLLYLSRMKKYKFVFCIYFWRRKRKPKRRKRRFQEISIEGKFLLFLFCVKLFTFSELFQGFFKKLFL